MANECVVYHKHLAGMDLTDGYIGISKNFEERMKQHHRDAFVQNSIYTVHERMRMYGDEVITSKIFEGSINECFDYEEELRPRWHMGWNMAIGGGRPGSGWKPNPNWLCNRLWHKDDGETTVSKNNTLTDIGKMYVPGFTQGNVSGGLSRVLHGKALNFKGWELANAQLVMRVKTKLELVWEDVFLKKVNDPTHVVYIKRTAAKSFYKKYKTDAANAGIKRLWAYKQKQCNGWELATKQEWLETAERVEFK